MVSEQGMTSACSDFTQNAWRKGLCANCQRPQSEHPAVEHKPAEIRPGTDSPKPAKRNSLMTHSTISVQETEEDEEDKWNAMCLPEDGSNVSNKESSAPGEDPNRVQPKSEKVKNKPRSKSLSIQTRADSDPDLKNLKSTRSGSVSKENFVLGSSSDVKVEKDSLTSGANKDKKKTKKGVKVGFSSSDPEVIGTDGGYDNLFLEDGHDDVDSSEGNVKESILFTEDEKEFALMALKNTLWNSKLENLKDSGKSKLSQSREYEDVDLEFLWKPDRFSNVRDCDALPTQNYGTFPLRTKSSKTSVDNTFLESNRMSVLSDITEVSEAESSGYKSQGLASTVVTVSEESSNSGGNSKLVKPYNVVDVVKLADDTEPNYEDPWEDKFAFDTESEMNLLDEIRGEIDLDSSSAGMALVDLLNDVLSKYSSGNSDTDSIKNFDHFPELSELKSDAKLLDKKGMSGVSQSTKEKNAELEAKMVTLAASLRLKQRGKSRAPRPPSAPPPEPVKSPSKPPLSAQNSEPSFRMVPIGKPIGNVPSPTHALKPSSPTPENVEMFRLSKENVKEKPKKAGGITSFFRNILRRGRDSDTDLSSSETLASNQDTQNESDTDKALDKRNSKSSPQMKLKVVQPANRPTSPKPTIDKMIWTPPARDEFEQAESSTDINLSVDKDKSPHSPPEKPSRQPELSGSGTSKSPETVLTSPAKTMEKKDGSSTSLSSSKSKEAPPVPPPAARMIIARARDTPNVPPPKPPVAAKPKQAPATSAPATAGKQADDTSSAKSSPPLKERISSTSSLEDEFRGSSEVVKRGEAAVNRRRAKSPKRTIAPSAPARQSMPPKLPDTAPVLKTAETKSASTKPSEPTTFAFAKELEIKLQKTDQAKSQEVKKPLAPPPPSPTQKTVPTSSEAVNTGPSTTQTADEKQQSAVVEPDKQETQARPVEKIELPRASASRKSFLGKLNRKSRPPPPPSVKRTKSITESSVLGDGSHPQGKKIDLKDISGPVLITEMSSNKVVNRRNTISLGDDSPFLSGGSTSSGSTAEKSDFSPRGSLENLYEPITQKPPDPPVKGHLYDPVQDAQPGQLKVPGTSIPIDGYLEPVRANTAEATSSMTQSTRSVLTDSTSPMTQSVISTLSSSAMNQSVMSIQENEAEGEPEENLDVADEERERILATQPIYEEINGYGKLDAKDSLESHSPIKPVLPNDSDGDLLAKGRSSPGLHKKESFSSDSDLSSASGTLSRPRPLPRRRPGRRSDGFEQYVAMNRPSVSVALNEEQLREILNQLTAMNLLTLREIYTQHEKAFTKDTLQLGLAGPLKWHDFDIYGKPIHTSERCIVYNAKLKPAMSACQVMLLHSKPEITSANHSSLLKATCIFTDAIPFSYLTEDFIKTSQLLENCVNQSNLAKCYIAVGLFDISESLTNHLSAVKLTQLNQNEFLKNILFIILQLLSAISHCVEQGHNLAESDFRDIFLITNPYCLGTTAAFLPQHRSPENQQIESVCMYLEKFLDKMLHKCPPNPNADDLQMFFYNGIEKIIWLLQARKMECLALVRSYTEFLLWGPRSTDLQFGADRQSSLEPRLSMWLEKQRADLVHTFAKKGILQQGAKLTIDDFYCMKFLLKASAVSLSECIRCHVSS